MYQTKQDGASICVHFKTYKVESYYAEQNIRIELKRISVDSFFKII